MRKSSKFLMLFILTLCSCMCFAVNVFAAGQDNGEKYISQIIEYYENGNYAVITTYQNISATRAGTTGHKELTYYDGGTPAWSLTVYGSFTFGNGSATCTGSSVLYSIHNSAWRKTSTSSTYNGNTATATGTFTKNNGQQDTCSVSVSCDSKGNIY